MSGSGEVVLVTGASGCVGQFVVKLLQENDETTAEIRCLDLRRYYNFLGHSTTKPMKTIVGDVRDKGLLSEVVAGVDCIIHCASVTDTRLFPDEKQLKSVNVDGTKNLLEVAIEHNVKKFIYLSTIDVVCGSHPIYYGAENTTPVPKSQCFESFARSKTDAERLVANANGQTTKNETTKLYTVIMRPCKLYGEGDKRNVTSLLRIAKNSNGQLPRVDNVFIRSQFLYVGNAAWAMIKAKQTLLTDFSIGGEEFFITDDTPIVDPFDFAKPFLDCKELQMSKRAFPYMILNVFLIILMLIVKLVNYVYPIPFPSVLNPDTMLSLTTTYFFNRNKATLRLKYKPIYDENESMARSTDYYKNLSI